VVERLVQIVAIVCVIAAFISLLKVYRSSACMLLPQDFNQTFFREDFESTPSRTETTWPEKSAKEENRGKARDQNMSAVVVSPCPAWEYEGQDIVLSFWSAWSILRVTVERLPPYCGALCKVRVRKEQDRHAPCTCSVSATPTAAPAVVQPTAFSVPLALSSLALPAPHPLAHTSDTTSKIPPESALDEHASIKKRHIS